MRPGLLPVVHTISVEVEAVTTHGIPSIMISFSYGIGENLLPVKVTLVPPTTLPNLGSILVKTGVMAPSYLT